MALCIVIEIPRTSPVLLYTRNLAKSALSDNSCNLNSCEVEIRTGVDEIKVGFKDFPVLNATRHTDGCFLRLCFRNFSIDAFMFISDFVRRNGGGRRGGTTASGALPPSPGVAGDSPGSPVLGTLDCGL